jgi:hypothetical protein
MVRNRERKTDHCKWSEENMLSAVKALKVDGMPLATATKTFAVPRNSLRRRVLSKVELPKFGQHTTFSKAEEKELVTYLVKLDNIGYGLTYKELRSLVYYYAFTNGRKHTFNNNLQMAGKDWVRGFMSHHRNLSLRLSEALSFSRARGMSQEKVKKFFDHLSNLLDNHNLWDKPANIFICYETSLQLIYKPKKVISQHGKMDVVSQTNCEKGETVSIMACVPASGHYIPPFVMMKGQR